MTELSVLELRRKLETGEVTSRKLVEDCLGRIGDASGEGARVFRTVDTDGARKRADAIDALRKNGDAPSPFAGIPISVKDLFDIEGQATLAGSRVLADAERASKDATSIARLRAAGFVIIGRTNMTEFAYSGLGINPHYGTPLSPYNRETGRVPGGSSSGAAVSVSDKMAAVGLGTDTGGSCRIPAAFCGTVGFKPTARRVPTDGATPLSFSLDSVGSMAQSTSCCAVIDSVISGEEDIRAGEASSASSLRVGVLRNLVLDGLDDAVATGFEGALGKLSASGVAMEDVTIAELDELASLNVKGGMAAAEAFAWHRKRLAERGEEYDPRIRARIEKGGEQSAAEYIEVVLARKRAIEAAASRTRELDAVIYPTVAIIPPTVASVADENDYVRINLRCLRNTNITNFLDGCAVSLPIHDPGDPPVGLNIMGRSMQDRELFSTAAGIEKLLSR